VPSHQQQNINQADSFTRNQMQVRSYRTHSSNYTD